MLQSRNRGFTELVCKIQGHGDRCYHYPEGEVRVFPGGHQESSGEQVQGGRGQEVWHPQQVTSNCSCHTEPFVYNKLYLLGS